MTPQEQQLLQGLTDRVNQTVLSDKDPDAEQFIFQQLGRNSDSLYILAQTVLVQQYALDQAKQQLDQAKQQLDQAKQQLDQAKQQLSQQQPAPQKHTSFLGNLLGMNDEPAHPAPPPPPQYAPVQNYPPPQYAPAAYGSPQYGSPQFGGPQYIPQQQGGGFLRSALQTATGVAAGALAFEGIESLMHGFGQHAGYGSGFDGGMGGGRPEEIINNNYYGDSAPGHEGHGDLADRFAAGGDQPSPDIEDRRDDTGPAFADTSNDQNEDQFDDQSDAQSDDTSSFDDSGDSSSDFSGGGDDNSSF